MYFLCVYIYYLTLNVCYTCSFNVWHIYMWLFTVKEYICMYVVHEYIHNYVHIYN